jgi:GR25 family glycosyltransferase involved in LPS biosynthesis
MTLKCKWKLYILSVKDCLERRINVEKLAEKAKNYGFQVEIIDGYYWKNINIIDKMNQLGLSFIYDGKLSQAQLACFLTHRIAWEKINETYITNGDTEIPIIIEDDMDLCNFDLFLQIEIDICNLNNNYDGIFMWKHPDKFISNFESISEHLIKFYFQWGLCAYIIRPKLCEKMLSVNYIDRPIDDYLYTFIFPNYKIYFTLNDPFINNGFLGGNRDLQKCAFQSLIYL